MESYMRNPSLNWAYFYQGKGVEELRHSLLCTTLELETTRMEALEEMKRREDQLNQLKYLLDKTMKERDEAQATCQRLMLDKLVILQQLQLQHHQNQTTFGTTTTTTTTTTPPISGVSSIEDEARRGGDSNAGLSSSDCEDSIVSSPVIDPVPQPPPPTTLLSHMLIPPAMQLTPEKPLPEKGKLLQAVMKAGPLLQTLLLAGPLPQWRHPPPPLDSFEIPPVAVPSPSSSTHHLLQQSSTIITNINNSNYDSSPNSNTRKRNQLVCEDPDFSIKSKCQRIHFH
ncbi:hypothetical protein Sjap_013731 [Stephania japonica]|uniref:Uncharacterized protein n=1 Tax=Stephania japonica TaxID=461633 RepID=A0AAP0IYF3_9MAGN